MRLPAAVVLALALGGPALAQPAAAPPAGPPPAAAPLPAARPAAGPPAAAHSFGHPGLPAPRPLHERLAAADVAAVVEVERIGTGRIAVRRQELIAGTAPEAFEVKRSPQRPPPLATGDRALLLLQGARPPYVLADEPAEVIRLSDDAMTERWSAAARAVLASREDRGALVALYAEWIENGPASLADLGRAGLLALRAPRPQSTPSPQ